MTSTADMAAQEVQQHRSSSNLLNNEVVSEDLVDDTFAGNPADQPAALQGALVDHNDQQAHYRDGCAAGSSVSRSIKRPAAAAVEAWPSKQVKLLRSGPSAAAADHLDPSMAVDAQAATLASAGVSAATPRSMLRQQLPQRPSTAAARHPQHLGRHLAQLALINRLRDAVAAPASPQRLHGALQQQAAWLQQLAQKWPLNHPAAEPLQSAVEALTSGRHLLAGLWLLIMQLVTASLSPGSAAGGPLVEKNLQQLFLLAAAAEQAAPAAAAAAGHTQPHQLKEQQLPVAPAPAAEEQPDHKTQQQQPANMADVAGASSSSGAPAAVPAAEGNPQVTAPTAAAPTARPEATAAAAPGPAADRPVPKQLHLLPQHRRQLRAAVAGRLLAQQRLDLSATTQERQYTVQHAPQAPADHLRTQLADCHCKLAVLAEQQGLLTGELQEVKGQLVAKQSEAWQWQQLALQLHQRLTAVGTEVQVLREQLIGGQAAQCHVGALLAAPGSDSC